MKTKKSILLDLYQLLTVIILPFTLLYIAYRYFKGKEDKIRISERLGFASKARPKGFLIWLHAASVGEMLSIVPLIKKLQERYKDCSILVTTGTVSSANMAKKSLPENVIHQFIPIDNYFSVQEFLKNWQPNLVLWTESEIWPCFIYNIAKVSNIILINARMSEKSYLKWQKFKSFSQEILNRFDLILAQSLIDAEYYSMLGANNAIYHGNIKYDADPLTCNNDTLNELKEAIGTRKTWLAASTHHDEESKAAQIHLALKKIYPDLLTIIVPRHNTRSDEIIRNIKELDNSLIVAKRSNKESIATNTDIYLADTMGELGLFYRLTEIVFVGGTLIPHGGQNPLEPSRLNNAILFGPYMTNFLEIKDEFVKNSACIIVKNQDELQRELANLFENEEKIEQLATASAKLVATKNGVIGALLTYLDPYVKTKIS